ncbi:MAG: hypothetical protein ACAI18_09060 [Gemmatimonadales bacterium]
MNHDDQETTSRTVVGMFSRRDAAEAAIRDLKAAEFTEDQIGLAMQDAEPGAPVTEGAASGALSGGVLGGLMGLLGSLLIPGLGPVVIGGVLASTLTGAGIGAATGGLIGALVSLGVPEEDARHFDEGLRAGAILVTIDAGSRTDEALAILQGHGMDLGPSRTRHIEASERRVQEDSAYGGPERRLVGAL